MQEMEGDGIEETIPNRIKMINEMVKVWEDEEEDLEEGEEFDDDEDDDDL